jgi:hypothetical protein
LSLYAATLDGHSSDHTIGHRGEGASGKPISGLASAKKSCRENKKSRDINEGRHKEESELNSSRLPSLISSHFLFF